jgi:GDP/UDP-N,N'-diacetylbacillosamine 2-epimerase (hydrolysing)
MNIPVAHLGAGDRTRVNIDGIIRHSVTKLSSIFFCSTKENAKRVLRLGEESSRIFTVGHTVADRYKNIKSLSKFYLSKYFNLDIKKEPLLIFIQHPVSNWLQKTKKHFKISLSAIDDLNLSTIIIKSNSDPGNAIMRSEYNKFIFLNKKVRYYENIPEKIFINIMRNASVLVGNSSMGVLEAPLLKLPVVNIGLRQKDRQNAGNILFVRHNKKKIIKAIKKSLYNKKYLKKIKRLKNPYGFSGAPGKIVKIFSKISINDKLISKRITY